MKEGIPQQYIDLVGTKQKFANIRKEDEGFVEYDVLDIRWGAGEIMDMQTYQPIHPTYDLLLKNDSLKKSIWVRGFPVPEINLKEDE